MSAEKEGQPEVLPIPPQAGRLRRGFLLGGVAAFSGLAGAGVGFKKRDQLAEWTSSALGTPTSTRLEFDRGAARIRALRRRQAVETIRQLKAKYEGAIFGKVRVWDMIEKLGMCVDASDNSLMLTSQYVHVQQVLEGMERDGVQDRDMVLIALLHDLGKVMLLTAEVPEHIVGARAPVGEFPRGVGVDNVVFQFGHDEMIYSRMKDHVPEHVAWTIRYHSAPDKNLEPYLNQRDREYFDRYLKPFQTYDRELKSNTHLPRVEMAKYRALIEDMFPQPILF